MKLMCGAAILGVAGLCATGLAEQIVNPAYTAWAKCKAGTTMTMQTSSEMVMPADAPPGMGGKSEQTVVTKLVSVAADKAVVEVTTTTAGKTGAAVKQDVPAKIEQGMELLGGSAAHGGTPNITNVKAGTETVDVGGKKVATVTREFPLENAPGATEMAATMKIWTSAEVPGGVVKSELHMTVPMTVNNTRTLVDFKVVK